jgi:hypothetical protein
MTVEPTGLTRKPKTMGASGDESHGDFQTDPAALEPLFYYIPKSWRVWECAAGDGNLVRGFEEAGYTVFGTDKYYSGHARVDYLTQYPRGFGNWDIAITNPPFKYKDSFLARAYEIGRPFAFLLPLTALEGQKRQALYRQHGLQVIVLNRRVKFLTPGKKEGGAWFAVAWYTWGLGLPESLIFWDPTNPDKREQSLVNSNGKRIRRLPGKAVIRLPRVSR